MSKTFLCALGLAAIAGAACGRPPAHPCNGNVECAVGWSCIDNLCEPTSTRDGAANEAGRDAGAEPEVPDRSSPWNYVFVTSEPLSVPFGSLEYADAVCGAAAAAAALPGTYRAWLSTTQTNARDRLDGARGWILTDGRPFADRVDDLVVGRMFNPPSLDEYGRRHDTNVMVFTGTTPEGYFAPPNCSDWSSRVGDARAGYRDGMTMVWTERDFYPCQWLAPIYCFGIDKTEPLSTMPAKGKLAFVSTGTFIPDTGVAGADAICAAEAATAGFTGRFKALLATTTSSAADRFSAPIGTVWVRTDGIPLNQPGVDLFTGEPLAPLNVSANGKLTDWAAVMVGARHARDKATPDLNCRDWSTTAYLDLVLYGGPDRTSTFFEVDVSTCFMVSAPVYCLED